MTTSEDDSASAAPTQRDGSAWPGRNVWTAIAIVVFSLALSIPFHDVLDSDLTEVVPMFPRHEGEAVEGKRERWWVQAREADQIFVAWLASRNAGALLSDPSTLFDSEQCHPAAGMLALGEPMITLGALGVPGYLLAAGDPVFTYDFALIAMTLLSALGMFWLIRDWTRSAPAGIVAGLIYGFAPLKLTFIAHPYWNDTVWTVFALLFVRRFFAGGRWRDAILTALFCALQMGGSFYTFLAACLLAIPMLTWLFASYGAEKLRPGPCAAALAILLLAAGSIYLPYLDISDSAELTERSLQSFATLGEFKPGHPRFPGWLALVLVGIGCALPRDCSLRGVSGDPRWALLAACPLVLLVAFGPNAAPLPDLYAALASFVPGLGSVRIPANLATGLHVALGILSGIGAAALLRSTPWRARSALLGAGLISICFIVTLRPPLLGLEPPVVYRAFSIRPPEEAIRFFQTLEAKGNRGPIFEVPVLTRARLPRATRILLEGYHDRPTSACYNSYIPSQFDEIVELGEALPEPEALERIRELGFTTIVAHHTPRTQLHVYDTGPLDRAASGKRPRLNKILETESISAYEIAPGGVEID